MALVSRLLEFIMHHCHHDNRQVLRNNLEVLKTVVEVWRSTVQVPTVWVFNFLLLITATFLMLVAVTASCAFWPVSPKRWNYWLSFASFSYDALKRWLTQPPVSSDLSCSVLYSMPCPKMFALFAYSVLKILLLEYQWIDEDVAWILTFHSLCTLLLVTQSMYHV